LATLAGSIYHQLFI